MTTRKRKSDHVGIVLRKCVQYSQSAGFGQVTLVHNPLPEIDFNKISLKTHFLGKTLEAPILIEAMTGGYLEGGKINRKLAEIAEKTGIAMGLGSQRAMIEEPSLKSTYHMRDVAPTIPIIANIGAYVVYKFSLNQIVLVVWFFEAYELAVLLNPLQEIIQPEGDKDFTGILDAIARTCEKLSVPVIAKETGAGIGPSAAKALAEAGVKYVDVAGAGGTSWSAIEYERGGGVPGFADWGMPTAACLIADKGIAPLIASGGLRNGIDAAKAIALGAEIAGAAQPFIRAYSKGKLETEVDLWKEQLKVSMFLTGARDVTSLRSAKVAVSAEMKALAAQL
ncbi:Isopentenyl-diphosphate delta-isomerase [uncultured archaeon]|nr:Isopentenyl-diphosphate delta-isomerase [uncultured archaeon]